MAGRFPIFTDACVDGHVVEALARRGWDVMRAIDASPEGTRDPVVFARAADEGRVFVTNDGPLISIATEYLEDGRPFRMIYWPKAAEEAWTVGEIVEAFEALAARGEPFPYPIYYLKPR